MNMNTMNESAAHMEKTAQGLVHACEEMQAVAREQMDAAMRSASAAWEGCTEINQNVSGLIQESMARAVSAGKTIAGAKSVREAMDLHAEFVKDCFDSWVAGTGRISEISARVTKDAVGPLAEHTNNAISRIVQRAKAA